MMRLIVDFTLFQADKCLLFVNWIHNSQSNKIKLTGANQLNERKHPYPVFMLFCLANWSFCLDRRSHDWFRCLTIMAHYVHYLFVFVVLDWAHKQSDCCKHSYAYTTFFGKCYHFNMLSVLLCLNSFTDYIIMDVVQRKHCLFLGILKCLLQSSKKIIEEMFPGTISEQCVIN